MTIIDDDRLPRRFWNKVSIDPSGCWRWTGAHIANGYGHFSLQGKRVGAHRVAYEALVGPIPDGLHIDHLCRVRDCVNPAHLEAVTCRENVRRGTAPDVARRRHARRTHCKRGHEYTQENTIVRADGRECRECRRVQSLAWYHRNKGRVRSRDKESRP